MEMSASLKGKGVGGFILQSKVASLWKEALFSKCTPTDE